MGVRDCALRSPLHQRVPNDGCPRSRWVSKISVGGPGLRVEACQLVGVPDCAVPGLRLGACKLVGVPDCADCGLIARNTTGRRSAVPDKVARTKGYAKRQANRKRIESIFAWVKVIGGLRKLKLTSLVTVRGHVAWVFAAYNLIRIGGLEGWWSPAPT